MATSNLKQTLANVSSLLRLPVSVSRRSISQPDVCPYDIMSNASNTDSITSFQTTFAFMASIIYDSVYRYCGQLAVSAGSDSRRSAHASLPPSRTRCPSVGSETRWRWTHLITVMRIMASFASRTVSTAHSTVTNDSGDE